MTARLPTLGETPYKDILDGFMLVAHNPDGTHNIQTSDLAFDNAHGVVVGDVRLSRSAAKTLNIDGLVKATGGLATFTKAGVIADSDITGTGVATAVDGLLAVDTSANTLMFRSGAVWRAAGVTTPSLAFTLVSGTSPGATSYVLDHTPPAGSVAAQMWILVGAFTATAEIRKVSFVTGATVNLTSALTYAHNANDVVLVIHTGSVTTSMWGCKGDNSTDDHDALQEAVRQTQSAGIWLDGQNKVHLVTSMVMFPPSAKLRQCVLRAKTTFAPVDTTNAVAMTHQGNIRTFTADPTTDIITAANHGVPADGIGVVFQGANLPGGLVAGKLYFAYNRTTDTFTVSASIGGGTVDITSAGSGGTVYCECPSLTKSIWEDVLIDANAVIGLTCVIAGLQQQGYWDKVRCDYGEDGFRVAGQQHVMSNFESIGCVKALNISGMSFLYVYGFNAEQCDRGIYVGTDPIMGNSAYNIGLWGCHFEMNDGSGHSGPTSIAIEATQGFQNITIDNVELSMQASGQTFMKVADVTSSYDVSNVRWNGGPASTGQTMLNDLHRGITLDKWDDFRGNLMSIRATIHPTSESYTDPNQILIIGKRGRRTSMGSSTDSMPSIHTRPSSTQTGDQYQAEDTSGVRVSGFSKGGYVHTLLHAAPAAGDVATGQMMFWFDQTTGAPVPKASMKDAAGTFSTVSLAGAGGGGVVLNPGTQAANTIQPTADIVPLTVEGKSGQTADLMQWQSSTPTTLSSVDSAGRILVPLGSVTNVGLGFQGDPNTGIYSPAADRVAMVGGGVERWTLGQFGRFSLNTDQINSATGVTWTQTAGVLAFTPASGSYIDLSGWMRAYTTGIRFADVADSGATGAFNISGLTASQIAMRIKAAASQTGDLIAVNDNTPAILSRFDKNGYFMTRKKAAPADGDLATSELAIWLDDSVGATKAMFKAKDSGGTVRTASVALS